MMGAGHAACVAQSPIGELAAVADLDLSRARGIAGELGAAAYGDHREVLGQVEVDALIVCTPDWAHREVCIDATGAGKHILVEKPLAMTIADCDAINAAAEDAGVTLMVGHILRFDPRYVAAKATLASGEIGPVSYLAARRSNKVGQARRFQGKTSVLHYLAVHDIDWMLWAMQEPVTEVYAASTRKALDDLGVDDAVLVILRFSGGAAAYVEAGWARPEHSLEDLDAYLEVVGARGAVHIDTPNAGLRVEGDRPRRIDTTYGFAMAGQTGGALREEVGHFLECVQQGREPLIDGRQGRAAVAVVEAALESVRTGDPVRIIR
jgi:predicted dehydrogenase